MPKVLQLWRRNRLGREASRANQINKKTQEFKESQVNQGVQYTPLNPPSSPQTLIAGLITSVSSKLLPTSQSEQPLSHGQAGALHHLSGYRQLSQAAPDVSRSLKCGQCSPQPLYLGASSSEGTRQTEEAAPPFGISS
ncbi:hypothetical protein AOLI_G00210130 [Acnodon oligacanthus]